MPIQPLIQTALFDVADWEVDAEFGVFPQGARAKDALFAPNQPLDPVIAPGKRYLFKRSKGSYPDQFWGEVVAYRIGCLLGVKVPPAFGAWNSDTGHCAALIEWFYTDDSETFVLAGDFLQKIQSDFDRQRGTQHNLPDNIRLLRMLAINGLLEPGWRQWWVDALLFDALIGNTDRHQDNWGFIFYHANAKAQCRLAPLFDNGTSLGHERFTNRIANWSNENYEHYIAKGAHHVNWSLNDDLPMHGHIPLLKRVLDEWPETRELTRAKLNFSSNELSEAIIDLVQLTATVPLTADRLKFMLALLDRRLTLLKELLQ